ncbi:MAG TPA: GNAT family N-acetyltransferase [Caulobacteraceae bacterium]|jgi:RimJ/RimL family protein N-acetyltransferase
MQASGPTLETDRLILRPPCLDDLEPWHRMMQDVDVARFIGGVSSRSQVWRMLMSMAGSWTLNGYAMFSVIEKASGRWVGRVGPWMPAEWPGTEVGWGLAREAWGKGYAVESAAASMDFVVDHLGWTDIIHCVDDENLPSAKVAERLGSKPREMAAMPAPYQDQPVRLWGQTADEWRANRKR